MMPHSVTSWGGVASRLLAAAGDLVARPVMRQECNSTTQQNCKADKKENNHDGSLAVSTVAFFKDLAVLVGVHREPPYRFPATESMPFVPATGVTNG